MSALFAEPNQNKTEKRREKRSMTVFIETTEPGNRIQIQDEDLRHLFALRPNIRDRLNLSDGQAFTYTGTIEKISKKEITVFIEGKEKIILPDQKIRLCTALLKGDKNEFVIQKATELGVDEILFFSSRNCVAKADGKEQTKKTRFEKTAKLAAMQCGGTTIPQIGEILPFSELAEKLNPQSTVFFYENADRLFSDRLPQIISQPEITLITGPEGGFDPSEAEILTQRGIIPISLGNRILRAETAPICGISVLLAGLKRM